VADLTEQKTAVEASGKVPAPAAPTTAVKHSAQTTAKTNTSAVGIGTVILAELTDICRRRGTPALAPSQSAKWKEECHKQQLFGICLSGGGIRSATFALGVLQGLAEKELLPKADYVSTVSGGGYIGSWLQGLLHRCEKGYELLKPRVPQYASQDPISFLRKYSNYLSPRVGLSLDAIVIPVIWFRNMLLNQAIIITAFVSIFLLLSFPAAGIQRLSQAQCAVVSWASMLAALVLGGIAVKNIGYNLRKITEREFEKGQTIAFATGKGTEEVGKRIVLPLTIAVVLLLLALISSDGSLKSLHGLLSCPSPWSLDCLMSRIKSAVFPWGVLALILWILLGLLQWSGGFVRCFVQSRGGKSKGQAWLHVIWMSLLSAALMWILFAALSIGLNSWRPSSAEGSQYIIAFLPPLYLIVLMLGLVLQIGLMGREFPDSTREWLARAGALLWTVVVVWAGFFAIAVFAPLWIAELWLTSKPAIVSAATAWAGSTWMSVLAGKSPKTGGVVKNKQDHSAAIDLAARYGPFIAIPGFLIVVAFGTQVLLRLPRLSAPFLRGFVGTYWETFSCPGSCWIYRLGLLTLMMAIFVILSLRVNINEFSMHHFYKNRLVRCYLGASTAQKRVPDSFTGFDPKDDMPLSDLRCDESATVVAPYPILNSTLTVTAGSELATQERKAVPWFFTPWYSGFIPAPSEANEAAVGKLQCENGFVDTSTILGGGVHLGTAMAISGAALSPNGGFHTAPQTAFLMTLFNVRLGWWTGNPRDGRTYSRSGPRFALWWLARELFGFVDERSPYLNLSDGGNFENLGLYELVQRRCHYVIAVDAEEDPNYEFGSLGAAVRKCRADFGVEIDIDPRAIKPTDGLNGAHCVVGRIRYPQEDLNSGKTEGLSGWLLYIKTSITGDEPADVEQYRRSHAEFPQQATLDQFFSESQFESYRRLGLHVLRTTMDHLDALPRDRFNPTLLDKLFKRLGVRWEPPPKAPEGAFARHGDAYMRLMHGLGASTNLKMLDPEVISNVPPGKEGDDAQRTALFFRLELLQFMENVFFDLNFNSAHIWNHPANAGWRSVFEYWARQAGMQTVWKAQRESYSTPFQNFFDDLASGKTPVSEERRV